MIVWGPAYTRYKPKRIAVFDCFSLRSAQTGRCRRQIVTLEGKQAGAMSHTSTACTTSDIDCSEYISESDTNFSDISDRINEETSVDSSGESESERGDKRRDKVEPYRYEREASGNSSISDNGEADVDEANDIHRLQNTEW